MCNRGFNETSLKQLATLHTGVGKTTAIRELSRYLAEDVQKRVIIVDTSNEIGGDGDVPHEGIGGCRRLQVKHVHQQHNVMIEAVEVNSLMTLHSC